jgi:Uma2 family endonuclease
MATVARRKTDNGQSLLLEGIDWTSYEKFLEAVGDRAIRLTYDRGLLEIAVPSFSHETWKRCIDFLIVALGAVLRINLRGGGSTTFRRQDVERGLEPDECYYIQHFEAVREVREIDLTRMPPPDLTLEVDVKSSSINRMGIYAALEVPEVWRFDGEDVSLCHLRNGVYESATRSLAFPVVTLRHVHAFLSAAMSITSDSELSRFAPQWVKKHILPLWRKQRTRKSSGAKRVPRPQK